jgi:anthranilate phosphoribosyltransferase
VKKVNDLLLKLIDEEPLSDEEIREALQAVTDGQVNPTLAGGLLAALKFRDRLPTNLSAPCVRICQEIGIRTAI